MGDIIPAVVKESGAKESFNDFVSGKTFSRAYDNIFKKRGGLPDPNRGVAYNARNKYVPPKNPKGCKVLTCAHDGKG